MMEKNKAADIKGSSSLKDSIARLAQKLDASTATKQGQIILHLSGSDGGDFRLDCGAGKTTVATAGLTEARPLIEVTGDATVVRAILDGKKDPLKQFAAGGLRVRGDLRYFSDLALELGIIDRPL